MTVQSRSRDRFRVLFGLIEQDPELGPALQRQSREGTERDSWFCLGMVSRNRTSLKSIIKKIVGRQILRHFLNKENIDVKNE